MTEFTIGDRIRQVVRIALCSLWTAVCYLVWLPGALVSMVRGRAAQRWNGWAIRWWTGGLLLALNFRIEVRGSPPPKPFYLVANHLSYVDILVLGSRLGATFVSKAELGRWPVLGHLARITGTIFINRENKRDALRVLGEIDEAIARGAGVVVFPEGTSSRGDRVYPLKQALLQWAAERQFPVHVATVSYATGDARHPADQAVCWWGDMTFAPHLMRLLAVPRPRAILGFEPEPVVASSRGTLATALHAALQRSLIPVMAEENK